MTPDHLRGDPVPGTELHLPGWTEEAKAERRRITEKIRARRHNA